MTKRSERLFLLSAKIPVKYVQLMDMLVGKGLYTSRSEIVREAIREKLTRLGVLKSD